MSDLDFESQKSFSFATTETSNMAQLVAEAFLSAAIRKIFERSSSRTFMNFLRGKKSIDDQLRALKRNIGTASLFLNDAEYRQISEPSVKKWLDDLEDVIFRADDLMEEIYEEARLEQELESGSIMKFMTPDHQFTDFDKTVRSETVTALEDLNSLLDKATVLGLKVHAQHTRSPLKLSAPLGDECHVYGRDADKEEILKLLLSDDVWQNEIGVLPIVGMGGLGKTTLAQLVYDDCRVMEHFELRAWVTVSTQFDVFSIMKSILKKAGFPTASGIEEPSELQRQLKETLRGKRFFFVFDDVWDESYGNWDFLISTLAFEKCGSRIIVTTHSRYVASIVKTGDIIYELPLVSDLDCWKIFVFHAFNGSDPDAVPCLQEIRKKILEKCRGLPLAVKAFAGLLRAERNPEKWECILRSHTWDWSKSQSSDLLPSLWLSYCSLPSCLKQCFAYCSILPKDYEFRKKELILLWMAQGFLQSDEKEKTLEEVGEEYFNVLVSRSLFRRSSHSKSMFAMHDLVHDLAVFVSGESHLRLNETDFTTKTRHLSHNMPVVYDSWKILSRAKHLRTFMGSHAYSSSQFVEKLIAEGRFLRVLSPSTEIWSWTMPDSFSNLKHLTYLNLSDNKFKELPDSICTLYKLQTLLLSNCKRLTRLPTEMRRLINLRHLDTTFSPLQEMPPQMGNLKNLQTLTNFVVSNYEGSSSIKELGQLQHLRGELCISGLQNVDVVEDVQKANLRQKEHLSKVTFQWQGYLTDPGSVKAVLNALEPHTNLKELTISGYTGSSFPDWVGDSSFIRLESVHLSGSASCPSLLPLGKLPSLRDLSIKSFHGVHKIGGEFYGDSSSAPPFQSLETLCFYDMSNWNIWSFIGDGKEAGCFPRLQQLQLYGCTNLTGSLPDCDTIETLEISWCTKLEFPGSHSYAGLRKLKIEGCDSLTSLPLDYFPMLKELVVQECLNLESLTYSGETGTVFQCLSLLRLVVCKNFRSLPEHMHMLLPSLVFLEISSCPKIESIPEGGLPCNIDTLVISNCRKLMVKHGHWHLHGLTSLRLLCITKCDVVLDSFPEGLLPFSLTSLKLHSLSNLRSLNGSAFQRATSLNSLSLSHCKELRCLPEEVLCTSLRSLIIRECPFLERRYQRWEGEDWHKISHILNIAISGRTTA